MFGQQGKGTKAAPKFEYELEREIKKKPADAKRIAGEIDKKVAHIKSHLRDGTDQESFMRITLLMHGYLAYKKVVEKIGKNS